MRAFFPKQVDMSDGCSSTPEHLSVSFPAHTGTGLSFRSSKVFSPFLALLPAFPPAGPLVCSLLLTLTTLTGCETTERTTEEASPTRVYTVHPQERTVTVWQEYTGSTQAVQTAAIVARVEGTLQDVHFRGGEAVKKDDVLFVIDPRMFRAKLEAAEAQLAMQQAARNQARIEYRRNQELFRQKAAAQTDVVRWREQLASSEASVRQAQAEVEQARIELGYTTIRAPFAGRITLNTVDTGNVISPQTGPLATLVAMDPVYVTFSANPQAIPSGSGALLELAVGEGPFLWKGQLDYVAPEIDPTSGTVLMRGVFPNPEGTLRPGQFVRVRMAGGALDQALLVPQQALGEAQGGAYLFLVDEHNKVFMKPVQTGPQIETMRVILKGVTPQDWVIVEGMARVRPGQSVLAVPVNE